MRIHRNKFNWRTTVSVTASVVISVFFVFLTVYSASTIGTNVSTGGTLSVSGVSTLTGNVAASGTLQVTGAAIFYDPVTFRTGIGASSTVSITGSTTIAGALNVSGAFTAMSAAVINGSTTIGAQLNAGVINASSTVLVNGSSTIAGALNVQGVARFANQIDASSTLAVGGGASFFSSSTVSGAFHVSGSARVGTTSLGRTSSSSPAQELSVDGDVYIGSKNSTTTLVIDNSRADTSGASNYFGAGCIQLRAADGLMVRIYASSSPPGGDSGKFGRSTGASLVVEGGMCETAN